jgi:rhodanese-related sulfurtransferase
MPLAPASLLAFSGGATCRSALPNAVFEKNEFSRPRLVPKIISNSHVLQQEESCMAPILTQPSRVLETPAASRAAALSFFQQKLAYETDPSDVYSDMQNGTDDFILLDVRSPEAFARSHAVGAINLPHVVINAATTGQFPKDKLLVVYCWGPGCNGATKAAMKLSALGFAVKEMIGGIEYWEEKERYPVARG